MQQTENDYPGFWKAWMTAARPKTWGVALAPVFIGLSCALMQTGSIDLKVALATALLSVLMQAITNMENDAGYTKKKAEKGNRKGLPRATSLGWLTVAEVERAIRLLAVAAIVDTAYLISVGGAVMALITAASIICAYCYMGGPKPLAYTPFSELCVFLFFGLTAVCGTFYLQTGKLTIACAVMACAMGMIATAVLVVNNYRDIAHDASIGRRTLAVLMGERRTEALYEALLTGPFILTAALAIGLKAPAFIIVAAALPQARKLIRTLPEKRAYELNPVLFATVKLELLFSALTTLGAVLHWLIAK